VKHVTSTTFYFKVKSILTYISHGCCFSMSTSGKNVSWKNSLSKLGCRRIRRNEKNVFRKMFVFPSKLYWLSIDDCRCCCRCLFQVAKKRKQTIAFSFYLTFLIVCVTSGLLLLLWRCCCCKKTVVVVVSTKWMLSSLLRFSKATLLFEKVHF